MPEVEPLRFPSMEGPGLQDQGDLQAVCPGRRRSCALVNTPSPCVNKAVCHIQELKRKLQDWCQQPGNGQHHMSQEKQQNSKAMRFQSSDSDNESLISAELCIEGIGLSARESGPLRKETTDVLVEVSYLIQRLEADRLEAEQALQTEKKRSWTLGKQVDCISLWKLQEFPVAVQKAHEACTRDISELKWHLKLKRDHLHQVKDRTVHTEVLNQRLNRNIDFVQKHGPLVREKLQLESDIMNQIKNSQREADETLTKTLSELKSSEKESKKEQLNADKEKEAMTYELTCIRHQLTDRLKECEQLQARWEAGCSKVKDTEEEVALKKEQCTVMSQRIPELEQEETSLEDGVLEFKIEIEEEVKKIAQLKERISELQKEIQATRLAGEAEVSRCEEVFRKKRQDLLALHEENREYELEIEDYSSKINESEEAVKQLQKDRKRMLQKIGQNEDQRDQAKEELSRVAAQHSHTKAGREELEQQTFLEEQRMREVMENLKKQMMGEMKALAILKGQIKTIKEELHREHTNTEEARRQLQTEFEEVSSATRQLEIEMEELRIIYDDKSENISSLTEKLSEIQCEHKKTSEGLEAERNLEFDHLNAVKELHTAVTKRFDHALSRIDQLTVKSKEYRDASDQMDNMAAVMPDVIEELQSVFDAVEFKNKTANLIMNTLQSDMDNCQQRTERSEETHTALFTDRRHKMEDIKADLATALRENVELAHEYRDLQKALMGARREAVGVFDQRNRAELSFHNHKQLSLLQKRMHKAVVRYFRQRGLSSQAQLAHFQALSNENNQKIKTLQEELSKAIRRVSAFLHSLTDGSTTGEDANKQRAGLDAGGLNKRKKTPAVQIAV